jgi:hypothetical protein
VKKQHFCRLRILTMMTSHSQFHISTRRCISILTERLFFCAIHACTFTHEIGQQFLPFKTLLTVALNLMTCSVTPFSLMARPKLPPHISMLPSSACCGPPKGLLPPVTTLRSFGNRSDPAPSHAPSVEGESQSDLRAMHAGKVMKIEINRKPRILMVMAQKAHCSTHHRGQIRVRLGQKCFMVKMIKAVVI